MLVRLGDNQDTTKVIVEALLKVIKRMHYPARWPTRISGCCSTDVGSVRAMVAA